MGASAPEPGRVVELNRRRDNALVVCKFGGTG
jgi:hypothetical protein